MDYKDNTEALSAGMLLSLSFIFVPACCQVFFKRVTSICARELLVLLVYLPVWFD